MQWCNNSYGFYVRDIIIQTETDEFQTVLPLQTNYVTMEQLVLKFSFISYFSLFSLYKLVSTNKQPQRMEFVLIFVVARLSVSFCVIISCRDNKNKTVNLWDGLHKMHAQCTSTCHQIWRLCGNFHFFVHFLGLLHFKIRILSVSICRFQHRSHNLLTVIFRAIVLKFSVWWCFWFCKTYFILCNLNEWRQILLVTCLRNLRTKMQS